MKLIKDLGMKKCKDRPRRWALFLCSYCNKEIERKHCDGLKQKSCGCRVTVKYNDANENKTRLYSIWSNMKSRCYNPNSKNYKYYGNKGIAVFKQWKNNYIIFNIWALCHGYKDNLTIDRRDNDKGYNPENCRWITMAEQAHNRKDNKLNWLTVRLVRALYKDNYTIKELFEIFNISKQNLQRIIRNKRWKEEVV